MHDNPFQHSRPFQFRQEIHRPEEVRFLPEGGQASAGAKRIHTHKEPKVDGRAGFSVTEVDESPLLSRGHALRANRWVPCPGADA